MERLHIAITSCGPYRPRRDGCRKSWLRWVDKYPGLTASFVQGGRGRLESDVMRVPCPDTYGHLPQKTYWIVEWALRNDLWLFKCDDDTFVHIPRLMDLLSGDKPDYLGASMSVKEWSGVYASGGAGYLLSPKSQEIIRDSDMATAIGHEDLMVGRKLNDSGVKLCHDARFSPWNTEFPTLYNDKITGHYIKPTQMLQLWTRIQHGRQPVENGDEVRD